MHHKNRNKITAGKRHHKPKKQWYDKQENERQREEEKGRKGEEGGWLLDDWANYYLPVSPVESSQKKGFVYKKQWQH